MLLNENIFLENQGNKTSKLNLIILPEYTEEINNYKKNFESLKNRFNLHFLDWSSLYEEKEDLKFQNLFEYIYTKLDHLKNEVDFKNCIFVGSGIGATIMQYFANKYKPLGQVLISPIYSTTFVNPFTSNIPSYKDDLVSYYIRLKKEYFRFHDYFIDKSDPVFLEKYNFYFDNKEFFDTTIAQISLYESLKEIREFENNFIPNTVIFMGVYDEVVEFDYLLKSRKFKSLNKNIPVVLFNESSHHLEFEENQEFISKLKHYANKWDNF